VSAFAVVSAPAAAVRAPSGGRVAPGASPGALWSLWPPRIRPLELRIDVELPADAVDADLRRLQRRLRTPGDALHRCATLPTGLPGLVLRHREADGEHYVYVQDTTLDRLAGFTVFNRLIELDRRADRVLRGPHSRYAPAYQRRGVASAVYGWALDAGLCLISGPRQSPGAHALWRALARRHPLGFVSLRDKALHWLGAEVDDATLEDFHTRMVLLGAGWDLPRFLRESRCAGDQRSFCTSSGSTREAMCPQAPRT
jgi:GNAT superfamily N-acetyltransferase